MRNLLEGKVGEKKCAPSDQLRKAEFREIARRIVLKDRWERKYHGKVDTGGAIARAMEHAYQLGYQAAQQGSDPQAPVAQNCTDRLDWLTIPPRPRRTFHNICFTVLGMKPGTGRGGHLIPAPTERATAGWSLEHTGRRRGTDSEEAKASTGDKTIQVLIGLGLLEFDKGDPMRVVVSQLGEHTWRYLCEHDDPWRDYK